MRELVQDLPIEDLRKKKAKKERKNFPVETGVKQFRPRRVKS
jgi:hypothetical protein